LGGISATNKSLPNMGCVTRGVVLAPWYCHGFYSFRLSDWSVPSFGVAFHGFIFNLGRPALGAHNITVDFGRLLLCDSSCLQVIDLSSAEWGDAFSPSGHENCGDFE